MEKYSSYKDSGVKWLGEIPSHWETRTLKYCCSLKGRIGWNGLRSEEFQYSSYAYLVTGQDFIGSEIDWSKCYQISQERYDEDPYIQLNNGDMLITKDGTIGKVAKVTNLDKPACLNSGIFVIKQKGTYFNQGFLYWMLCSNVLKEFNIYTQTGATIAHLYQNVFENMPCILPPLSEQNAIASYLDSVTTQIDTAIFQQQKMIELLNERKQIIINNAVTKGLDPNVKMKDSGVDWIGEIPEGWEVCSLKKVATIILGKMLSNNPTEKYPYLCAKDVHYGNVDLSDLKMMYFSKEERERYRVQNGDMLIVEGGAGAGGCAVFDGDMEVFIQNSIMIVRGNSNMDNRFICYFFQTINQKGYVEFICNKATIPHFTKEKVGAVMLPIPPIEEQMQIVNKIKSICEPIDNAINAANKQISLLQERKQIIINDVVTGKVKVS